MSSKIRDSRRKTKKGNLPKNTDVGKLREKEKSQRKSLALMLLVACVVFIGGPMVIIAKSHQVEGHTHVLVNVLIFDALLIPATAWAVYNWLKK